MTDRIVANAEKLYLASGSPPAHVTVLFGSWVRPDKVNRDDTARRISEIVRRMDLKVWERKVWRWSDVDDDLDDPVAGNIDSVHAVGVPEHGMGGWGISRAGWVAPLSLERLQSRVSEKSGKIGSYRQSAEENWLLVVVDRTNPSQAIEIPAEFPAAEIVSVFSRTFYFEHPSGQVIELGNEHFRSVP